MEDPALSQPIVDVYEAKPFYRWLALIAAVLAWGFDGVEQGVYSIMTRAALADIMPATQPMVEQVHELQNAIKAAEAADGDTSELQRQKKELIQSVDKHVGPMFSKSLAMWLWGAALGGVLFGRLGDKHGRVRMLLLAVLTYSVFTGLSAFSTHYAHILAARFLGAIGLGGTWPLCVALVVETWHERFRAVLAGAIGAAANVGYLVAGLYSGYMLDHGYSWRWVIGMGFFFGIASLPFIFVVPEPTKWKRSRQKKERSSVRELFSPEFRRATIVGSLLSTVGLLGTWGAFLWLPTYVDAIATGTPNAKAIITQWQSVGAIAGGFVGGLLAGWLGSRLSYIVLCVGAWSTVIALFQFNSTFSLQLKLMAVPTAIFVTAFFGWLPKYLPELYPTRIRAAGQGFAFNIGRVLAGLGVLGTGSLVGLFHGDYRKGVMVTASVYLLGLLVIWFAPHTGGKMREDTPAAPDGGDHAATQAAEARA